MLVFDTNKDSASTKFKVGAVVIGRNEGERLRVCLRSLLKQGVKTIYVDSNSSDDSVEFAKSLKIDVVLLDRKLPFTAARARNVGFARLIEIDSSLDYIQFVDGDCEVANNWIVNASNWLDSHPEFAIACGRRRERYPKQSIYNRHCDIEWDTPVGEAKACGGDFLIRTQVFRQVEGFSNRLIAGEEPELCIRIRQLGWKIMRLDMEMTLHDANITQFKQFWRRSVRSGYAFSKGVYMHGDPPEKHWVEESRRCFIWGGLFPLTIIVLAILGSKIWEFLLLLYLIQWLRLVWKWRFLKSFAFWQATLLLTSKFSEFQGQLKFLKDLVTRKDSLIIEYH